MGSPGRNCENCNNLSPQHVRMASRRPGVFLSPHLWTRCPEARCFGPGCRSPPVPSISIPSLSTNVEMEVTYDNYQIEPLLPPPDRDNHPAVMQAYGFSVKVMTESKCVAELMKMYQKLTEN